MCEVVNEMKDSEAAAEADRLTKTMRAMKKAATEQKSDSGEEDDFVAVSRQLSPPTTDALPVRATRFDAELAELASLGFGEDADRNLALLERFNGRVFRVVNAILDMAGAD